MSTSPVPIPKQKLLALCDNATGAVISKIGQTWFDVTASASFPRLRAILEQAGGTDVSGIVIDASTFNGNAIETMREIARVCPQPHRILMTQQVDLTVIVHGLHSGVIHRIVYKPINPMELAAAICPKPLGIGSPAAGTTASTSPTQHAYAG